MRKFLFYGRKWDADELEAKGQLAYLTREEFDNIRDDEFTPEFVIIGWENLLCYNDFTCHNGFEGTCNCGSHPQKSWIFCPIEWVELDDYCDLRPDNKNFVGSDNLSETFENHIFYEYKMWKETNNTEHLYALKVLLTIADCTKIKNSKYYNLFTEISKEVESND